VSPGSSRPPQPVPGPTAGAAPGGSRAAPRAARWCRARWRVGRAYPPACRVVVGAPGLGRGRVGVVRAPVLTPPPGAGVMSPAPEAQAWCGRVALRPVPWAGRGVLACVGACVWGRAVAVRDAGRAVSPPRQARPGGRRTAGWWCRARGRRACGPLALAPCQPPLPTAPRAWRKPEARGGTPGWWRSVAGRHGTPRRSPAPQQRHAGDGGQRPLLRRSPLPAAPDARRWVPRT